jgi:chloramphenicol 3-O-phosphotransferase
MCVTHSHQPAEQARSTADGHRSESMARATHRRLRTKSTAYRSPTSHRMNQHATGSARVSGVVARCLAWAVLGAVLVGIAAADSAHAATAVVVAQQVTSVSDVFTNIRNWLVGILAGLATVFLTIGGVRYLMASGDPGEVEKAKQAFKSAGWGYGLAALAPVVVEILKGIVGV